jgi:hypothetical protein
MNVSTSSLVTTVGDFKAGKTGALSDESVLRLFGTAKATTTLTSAAKTAVDASGSSRAARSGRRGSTAPYPTETLKTASTSAAVAVRGALIAR